MRAQERYQDSKGDFYAAGITYFTIFALFPLLMVAFAIAGFVLARQPDLLAEITRRIKSTVSGDLGQQLVELMDSAIESRTSVGIIGLATAAWAGLGWMANLREALSQMWGLLRGEPPRLPPHQALGSDRASSACSPRIIVTIALTALGSKSRHEAGARMAWAAGLSGHASSLLRAGFRYWSHCSSRGCCSPGSSRGCRGRRSAFAARRGPG